MKKDDLLLKLEDIFKDVFDDENITIKGDASMDDVEGWDSLTHITLTAAIENEFDVKFTLNEILDLKDAGSILDILEKKLLLK